jgi:hypothetical protein
MRSLFADTFYWVALLNPGDAFHGRVAAFSNTLGAVRRTSRRSQPPAGVPDQLSWRQTPLT